MKDNINFHGYMKMCRKTAGITLEELGRGLYSKGMMTHIEKGKSLPDYMMRNRIISRLGVSSEGYEDFLQPEEYNKYLERESLMELIEQRKIMEAEREINRYYYEHRNKIGKIERQFLYDMEARCLSDDIKDSNQAFECYKKACACTIDTDYLRNEQIGVWSVQEYYLLFKLLETKAHTMEKREEIIEIIHACSRLLDHIEKIEMDDLGKAKIYPMGTVALGNILKKFDMTELYCESILEKIETAIFFLRKKCRSYYLIELLEHKEYFLKEAGNVQTIDETKRMLELFRSVYDTNRINGYMQFNCYIYRDSDIYCIGDVIKSRRELLGISREELAEKSYCSYKTLMRIENKSISGQRFELSRLLGNLCLSENYMRSDIITEKKDVMDQYFKIIYMINNDINNAEIDAIKENLEGDIDLTINNNAQIFDMISSFIMLYRKEIEREEFVERLREQLKMSLPLPLYDLKLGYLTHIELNILKGILKNTSNNTEREFLLEYLMNYCIKHKHGTYPANFGNYENVMVWVADAFSDKNNIEIVEEISREMLLLQLKTHRIFELHSSLYMILRNNVKTNSDIPEDELINQIEILVELCDFIYNTKHKAYYNHIKELIIKGECWVNY